MGNCRDDLLAEYYLRAAGVAVIWIEPDGFIGANDVARLNLEPGAIGYCCARGAQFVLAYRLQVWKQEQGARPDLATFAAKIEDLAAAGGVGITEHSVAIGRAREAVRTVNEALDRMKENGDLRELNQAFKVARAADPALRYGNFLHARKAAMLEAIAMKSPGAGFTPSAA
jgi:hypothetical protein